MLEQSKTNILLVDDRPRNLYALCGALANDEYNLLQAQSGPEALSILEHDECAVILLDVQMPGMDGFATATEIRKIPKAKSTPIIFVTAINRDEDYVQLGYSVGAVDYLFKPLNIDIIRSKVAVFVDLYKKTQQVQLQERQISERDEFLSIASHELRTPLTSVYLQLQLLADSYNTESSSGGDFRRRLDISLKQTEHLGELIDTLIDISRFAQGRLNIEKTEFDLSESVRDVAIRMGEQARTAGCDLTVTAQAPLVGSWDRLRVEQALTNLISNSIKYGAKKPIHVSLELEGSVAKIKVEDHGMGVSSKDLNRIFDRFERAVSYTNISGLGLGLFITRQIAEIHGGTVKVESEPQRGSTFTLELPLDNSEVKLETSDELSEENPPLSSSLNTGLSSELAPDLGSGLQRA